MTLEDGGITFLRNIRSHCHCHLLSLSFTLTVTYCHCHYHCHLLSLSFIVTVTYCQCHLLSPSLTVTYCHSLSLTVPHCHLLSLSLTVTVTYLLSLPITSQSSSKNHPRPQISPIRHSFRHLKKRRETKLGCVQDDCWQWHEEWGYKIDSCSGDGTIKTLTFLSEIKIHITRARIPPLHDLLPATSQQLTITAAGTLLCSINDVMRGNADWAAGNIALQLLPTLTQYLFLSKFPLQNFAPYLSSPPSLSFFGRS